MSVVIATLARPDVLATAIRSVRSADPPPTELIVVDGDAKRSAESVAARMADDAPFAIRYVAAKRGLTRQRNVALEVAIGDVVVFLDDDAEVEPSALGRLVSAYLDPGVVGATGRVEEPSSNRVGDQRSPLRGLLPGGGAEGTFTRFGYPRRLVHLDVARDVEFMPGCFMSARRSVAAVVRFDEQLPGYGLAEDEDFSYRLARLGRIRYVPEAVAHHAGSGFGTRDSRTFGRQVVRNRAYLFRKNFPQTPMARVQFLMLLWILVLHRLLNRDLRGVLGIVEGAAAELRTLRG
jgi:GT2 family glycosyltransferase